MLTIVASLGAASEVAVPGIGSYAALIPQVIDLVINIWTDAKLWFFMISAAVFVFVVLPAIWSGQPERRQAAAEMFDRILRFRRRQ
ncbi:hypothetical protein ABZ860_28100 [Microbispora sp. NPDC046973]|uniref:hypothetical protein n=1 Tax=Microbispora sp. NPDC046973 TaxID=3155022 RepID=UPI0033D5C6E4